MPNPTAPAPQTYGALSAFRWLLMGNLTSRLVVFGASALLARTFAEEELGVYRQVLSFHAVLFPCLALGLDQIYISNVASRAAAWGKMKIAAAITAVLLSLIMLAGSPWILDWMALTAWKPLAWIFPLVVCVQAAKVVWKTPLIAQLDFRTIAIGELMYTSLLLVGAVVLSKYLPTAIGLYAALLIAESVEAVYVRYYCARVRAGFTNSSARLEDEELAKTKRFCTLFTLDQALNAIGAQSPIIILGAMNYKSWAAAYSNANVAVLGPLSILLAAISRVVLPDMARLDDKQIRERSLMLVTACAWLVAPILAIAAAMGNEMAHFLFGQKWVQNVGPLITLTCAYLCVTCCLSPLGSLDILRNKLQWGVAWNLATSVVRIAVLWYMIPRWGMFQALVGFALVSLACILVWGWVLTLLVPCSVMELATAWFSPLPVWVGCYLASWYFTGLADHSFIRLLIGAGVAAVYYGLVVAIHPQIRGLVRRVAGGRV